MVKIKFSLNCFLFFLFVKISIEGILTDDHNLSSIAVEVFQLIDNFSTNWRLQEKKWDMSETHQISWETK